jgi:hypothetical protein
MSPEKAFQIFAGLMFLLFFGALVHDVFHPHPDTSLPIRREIQK